MSVRDELDLLLERKRRVAATPRRTAAFAAALQALRAWQARRLADTYRDFRDDPSCAPALQYFLSDLYGPGEFAARDRDLARAWVYLRRTLPPAMLEILRQAIELDVLTLELDHAMVRGLAGSTVDAATYAAAYRAVGDVPARSRQIDLIVGIGTDLSRVVRHRWLGPLLQAAHVPAHAAGFGVLQDFLERGYAAFRGMQDAGRLLATIRERETGFMRRLLASEDVHA